MFPGMKKSHVTSADIDHFAISVSPETCIKAHCLQCLMSCCILPHNVARTKLFYDHPGIKLDVEFSVEEKLDPYDCVR